MTRLALVTLLTLLLPAACGKKKRTAPPAPPAASKPAKEQPKPKPPGGVPHEFVNLINTKWPEAEREGDAFLAKFKEAAAARKANDRDKLKVAIDEAAGHYRIAKDAWAEIAYWPINEFDDGKIDQKTVDRCERYIKRHSSTVKGWDKKAKGLQALSTVK